MVSKKKYKWKAYNIMKCNGKKIGREYILGDFKTQAEARKVNATWNKRKGIGGKKGTKYAYQTRISRFKKI